MRQLLLSVQLRDDAVFENFYCGDTKALSAVVGYLQVPRDSLIYLSGKPHSGLTHLLQAMCRVNKHCLYLPLKEHMAFSPQILENSAALDLIALDDIDAVAGDKAWEEAIFYVFTQMPKQLVIASHMPPAQLAIRLADLKSRLQSMLLLNTVPLSDTEKLKALQLRAKTRGFVLTDEAGQFLLNHASRDMHDLFQLLKKLDTLSLAEKRKLTIPFIRKNLCKN